MVKEEIRICESSVASFFSWPCWSLAIVEYNDLIYAEHSASASYLPCQSSLLVVCESTVLVSELAIECAAYYSSCGLRWGLVDNEDLVLEVR